jgi:phage terminase Nu1 subunit (DNA packaging protein)
MSARPSLAPPPEAYVDARRIAELFGVSLSTVKRWRQAGLPSVSWGMKRTRRYLPSECARWLREREAREGDDTR